jgi:hypothetical protein
MNNPISNETSIYVPIDHERGEKQVPWNSVRTVINGRAVYLYSVLIEMKSVQFFWFGFQAKADPQGYIEPSNYVTFDIREVFKHVFNEPFPSDSEWMQRWATKDTRRMLAAVGKMLNGRTMPEWRIAP